MTGMSMKSGHIVVWALVSGLAFACGSVSPSGGDGAAGTTGTGGASGRVPQKHRAAAVVCAAPASCVTATSTAEAGGAPVPRGAAVPTLPCTLDTDCTAGTKGQCVAQTGATTCQCVYDSCSSDADCAQMGGPCVCASSGQGQGIVAPAGGAGNVCRGGNCRLDADCGAGGYCSPSLGTCGNYGGVTGYYCHTAADKCVDDADCAAQGGGDCRYDSAMGHWDCETSECVG
jgi:hypothetical protein